MKILACKLLVILLVTGAVTGCWDSQELDTISLVTGVGIDEVQQPDEANFVFQIVKIGSNDPGNENSFFVMESQNKGILPALDALEYKNTRSLFLHQNQVIVIGKEQAEKGIKTYLDAFLRGEEMRMETWLMVADGTAKDILSTNLNQEPISSVGLVRMMETERQLSQHITTRMLDFTVRLLEEGGAAITPIIQTAEENGISRYKISGLAVFKDAAMVGRLDAQQKRGFYWIMGDIDDGTMSVTTSHGFANLIISEIDHTISPRFTEDGKPYMQIDVLGYMAAGEVQGYDDMDTLQMGKDLEKEAQKKMEEEMRDSLQASQRMRADIFRFAKAFERWHPKEWETMQGNWEEIYQQLSLNVNITLKMRDTGKTTLPFNKEVKEENAA
ncbi:Ger(x)C family spore germination protein [Oscillospiraceae bacterium MB08-C2-2]|nr:Ger(x)C family spore germination protein [Oscillospiraceae bacterium MB08-C2-2]